MHLTGAVEAAINTGYRGQPLIHAMQNSRARFLLISEAFIPALAEVRKSLTYLETVIVYPSEARGQRPSLRDLVVREFEEVQGARDQDPGRRVEFSDVAAIVYTSGTTGPAKGVIMPHGQIALFAQLGVEGARMTSEDVHYCSCRSITWPENTWAYSAA